MKRIISISLALLTFVFISCTSAKEEYEARASISFEYTQKALEHVNDYATCVMLCKEKADSLKTVPPEVYETERQIYAESLKNMDSEKDVASRLCQSAYCDINMIQKVPDECKSADEKLKGINVSIKKLFDYVAGKDFNEQEYKSRYDDIEARVQEFEQQNPAIAGISEDN